MEEVTLEQNEIQIILTLLERECYTYDKLPATLEGLLLLFKSLKD